MRQSNCYVFAFLEVNAFIGKLRWIGNVSNSNWKIPNARFNLSALPTCANDHIPNFDPMIVFDPK